MNNLSYQESNPKHRRELLGFQIPSRCLRDRQLPACTLDDLKLGNGFQEFEAVAEGIALAGESVNRNIAGRNRKLQPNNLSQTHFLAEHSRNPGFADVDRVSSYYGGVSRIDADIDFELVTWMTAGFDHN